MTAEFWAIIGVGVFIVWAIDDFRKRMEAKLDILIDEAGYPNREARRREMLGRDY